MATFTVKVTLSGSVAGRTVSYTHTGTFTGIEEVVQDSSSMDWNGSYVFSQTGSTYYRGRSDFSGISFACISNQSQNQLGSVRAEGSSDQIQFYLMRGVPMLFWHSHDYDAAIRYDATTANIPDQNLDVMFVQGLTGPIEYKSIAFFRAIT